MRIVRDRSDANSFPPLHELLTTLSQKEDAMSLKKLLPLVMESSDYVEGVHARDLMPLSALSIFIERASAQAKASIYMPVTHLSKDKLNRTASSSSSSSPVILKSPRALCLTMRSAQHAIGEVFTNDKQSEYGHSTPSAFWFSKNDESLTGGTRLASHGTAVKKGDLVPHFAILGRVVSVRMQVDNKSDSHEAPASDLADAAPVIPEQPTTSRISGGWIGFGKGKNSSSRKNGRGFMRITLETIEIDQDRDTDEQYQQQQFQHRSSSSSFCDSINVMVQFEGPPPSSRSDDKSRGPSRPSKTDDRKLVTQLNSYLDGAVLPLGFGPGCILAVTKVERRYPAVNQSHRPYLMGSIGEDGTMVVLQTRKQVRDFMSVHIMIDAPRGSERLPLWKVISDGSCSRAHFWLHNVKILDVNKVKCMWVCVETGDELEPLKQDMALLPSAKRELIDRGEKLPVYSVGHALGAAGVPSEVALSLPMIRSKDRHKFFSALTPSLISWKEVSEPALSVLSRKIRKKMNDIVLGANSVLSSSSSPSSFSPPPPFNDVVSSEPTPLCLAPGGASFVFSCGLKISDGTGEARVATSDRYVVVQPDLSSLIHGTYLPDSEYLDEKMTELRFPNALGPSAMLTNMTKRQLQHWMAVSATVGTLERMRIFDETKKGVAKAPGGSDVNHFKSKEMRMMIATELADTSGVSTRLKRDRVAAAGQLYDPRLQSFAEDDMYLKRVASIKDMILYATNSSLFTFSDTRSTMASQEGDPQQGQSQQSSQQGTQREDVDSAAAADSAAPLLIIRPETEKQRLEAYGRYKKPRPSSDIIINKPLGLFKKLINDEKIVMNAATFEAGAGIPEALYYFASCLSTPYIRDPTAISDYQTALLPQHVRIGEAYFDSAAGAEALFEQLVKFTRDEFSVDDINQRKKLLCERHMASERDFDPRARAAQTDMGAYSREMIWRRDAAVRTWAHSIEEIVTEAFSSNRLLGAKKATSEYLVPREPNTQPVHPKVYEKEVSIGVEKLKSLFMPMITLRVVRVV